MFVDASALAAILLREKDFAVFALALKQSDTSLVTPFVVMEVGLAVMRELSRDADDVHADIEAVLKHFRVINTELTPPMILAALQAYERYGKGRSHPAKLNMGDCLSYGAARVLGMPLLFKGNDFALTDILSALTA